MNNQVLLYDDHCPLCVCYTRAFVKWGLLKPEERQAFSSAKEEWLIRIDFEKARNEIPYLNTISGEVLYGIDALLEILGKKLPFVKPMGRLRPVNWLLRRLYRFISYNRKVIVAKRCGPGAIDCSPDLNYFYRWLFMGFFLVMNTLLLFPVHETLLSAIPGYRLSVWELQAYHAGLVLTNILTASLLGKQKATEYLGQINMLAVITMLCLGFYVLLLQWFSIPVFVHVLILLLVSGLVISEYARRFWFLRFEKKDARLTGIHLISAGTFLFLLFN